MVYKFYFGFALLYIVTFVLQDLPGHAKIDGRFVVSAIRARPRPRKTPPRFGAAMKPYWGKPVVRNFRGGEGNVGMVWQLFATRLERADTTEADRPKLGAPSLYSVTWRETNES